MGDAGAVPYQTRMVEEVIEREGFGKDDVPDLLFVNYKAIDHASHIWSVNSPEMEDMLKWQDADLRGAGAASSTSRSASATTSCCSPPTTARSSTRRSRARSR